MLAGGIIIVLLIGVCYTQREIINLKKDINKKKFEIGGDVEKSGGVDRSRSDLGNNDRSRSDLSLRDLGNQKKDSRWAL